MQVQSLRQRLNDLKKASIELKSKVLHESRTDLINVSQILMNVLPNSSNLRVSLPLSHMNTLLDIPLSRTAQPIKSSSNQSLIYSPNSSVFAIPTTTPPRNQDLILWNSGTSHESSPSRECIQQQIEKLRLQNDEIQAKISRLNSQISDLKVLQSLREQQGWKKHLPFINKDGTLRIFLTKLHIKQYDFDKVDYEQAKCQLLYDKFTFFPNHRPQKTLKLSTISQVKYIGDKKMRIQFKEEQIIFLYLQFASISQRQQWDLAFVVNHKIITDKELNKNVFLQERQLKISNSRSKSSLKGNNDLQQRSSQFKFSDKDPHKRKESVRFTERKIERSNHLKQSHSSLKKSDYSMDRNQLDYTLNGLSTHSPESPDVQFNSSRISASSNREKSLKDFMVFGEVGESHQQSRTNTSKFNAPQVNFENMQFYTPFTKQPMTQSKQQIPKYIKEYQKALFQLKQGYFFSKYAKNGFKPHNKKIFISSEQEMLICANSEDLNERRAIRIENITAFKYPAIGQGIRKYVKNAKVENFCVIEYQNQGKDQVIELGCNKMIFIKRFSEQFRQFLHRKGVLIND